MIAILMMLAKLATSCLCKIKLWCYKFLSITSLTKFYYWLKLSCRCGHVTKVWSLSHFSEGSYHNFNFIRFDQKKRFLRGGLGSSYCCWLSIVATYQILFINRAHIYIAKWSVQSTENKIMLAISSS